MSSEYISGDIVHTGRSASSRTLLLLRLAVVFNLLPTIASMWMLSPYCPPQIAGWVKAVVLLPVLSIACTIVLASCTLTAMVLGPQSIRHKARIDSVCLVSLLLTSMFSVWLESDYRMRQFRLLASRSTSLVNAINLYQRGNGKPPAALADLVPRYLDSAPETGMSAYPDYEYSFYPESNAWELSVPCASGFMEFDRFYYRSDKKYDQAGIGWTQPVKDWAYFHSGISCSL